MDELSINFSHQPRLRPSMENEVDLILYALIAQFAAVIVGGIVGLTHWCDLRREQRHGR